MKFAAFKKLVSERENLTQAFAKPLAKSTSYDQLRHNVVVMLNCDQWGVDVVEFAEGDDIAQLHELAEEILQAQLN
jgi:hypothetical protein